MSNIFGDLPEEILSLEIQEFESEYKTLALMLVENCEEEIEKATYTISNGDLRTFTAWTKNYVLSLKFTPLGYFLMKSRRNFQDLEFLDEMEPVENAE